MRRRWRCCRGDDLAGPGGVPGAVGVADPLDDGRPGRVVSRRPGQRPDLCRGHLGHRDRRARPGRGTGDTDQPFTVFYPDGTSAGASAERSAAVELAATRGESLVAQAEGGRVVLVAVGLAEGTAVIQTFVAATELTDGVVRTWLVLAALGACLVVLGVLVADRLARNLVRPVVEASQVSHRLAAGDLDARAVPGGPNEIREVAAGLNHLADRIGGMLREERESVADLSHRLGHR